MVHRFINKSYIVGNKRVLAEKPDAHFLFDVDFGHDFFELFEVNHSVVVAVRLQQCPLGDTLQLQQQV